MNSGKLGVVLSVVAVLLFCGVGMNRALSESVPPVASGYDAATVIQKMQYHQSLNRMRAEIVAAAQPAAAPSKKKPMSLKGQALAPALAPAMVMPSPGGTPNYFGPEPNWSYTPAIRKFMDKLPGLTAAGANGLGQYVPVAVADTATYAGAEYYEIALVEYTEKMHTDLLPTTLRGYVQLETTVVTGSHYALKYPNGSSILNGAGQPVYGVDKPHYMGPLISATKNKPVRIKFTNYLPTGAGGNLFLPVDTTEMGAGMGPLEMNTTPGFPMNYTENRGTLHLHGGHTPWISDGTPHQWITPAGESTDYPKGVSVSNVPDMPDPGDGSMTFFYTNQQSARLMFYHDHAYGITRLNVYAGEAAAYMITDTTEQDLITRGIIPADQIPLVFQDKTFVDPATVLMTDPTWPFAIDATRSNLWYPHVYMPNQNPNSPDGANGLGRWDYGPWFWPPWPVTNQPIVDPGTGIVTPNIPDLSMTMEAFNDTPVLNGTPYPYLVVQPKSYRFRILNAGNDRGLNLQLYQASNIVGGITVTAGGSGYTGDAPLVTISRAPGDTTGTGATAEAVVDPGTGAVIAINLLTVGSQYTLAPIVMIAPPAAGTTATATSTLYTGATEVGMVPAVKGAAAFPAAWTVQTLGQPGDILDARIGGVPDPAMMGPSMIQIGTEGGFLPAPVVWPNIPLGYERNPKSITVGNVLEHNLFLMSAERADVIVDFSAYAGKTLILYNDAPAAIPAPDSRLDYFTCDQDQTASGGTTSTLPGYGPNVRTLMQIRVASAAPAAAFDKAALDAEFATNPSNGAPGVFARSQNPIIVPQEGYNSAYNAVFPGDNTAYARISDLSLTFTPMGQGSPVTIPFQPKAIAEEFESTYGRMQATLGVEVPFTNGQNQTTIFYGYIDPASEIINNSDLATPIGALGDGTQLWKITHNGVDTHPVHFHLFDVQLVNRVAWDGAVHPPEANELGWKDTVRMNPLQDCIVALRPTAPTLPFKVADSVRPLDPTMPIGSTMGFKNIDTAGNPITVTNQLTNFGWEYVWHCHILSHEEMDFMRPMIFLGPSVPGAPTTVLATGGNTQATVSFLAPFSAGSSPITQYTVTSSPGGITHTGATSPITVTGLTNGITYTFTVTATNAVGTSAASLPSNGVKPGLATGPGDLNGDGVVNILDLRLVIAHLGQTAASPGWDPRADANGNGVVTMADLLIVLQNFGKRYV